MAAGLFAVAQEHHDLAFGSGFVQAVQGQGQHVAGIGGGLGGQGAGLLAVEDLQQGPMVQGQRAGGVRTGGIGNEAETR